jgi:hypothetical protein
MGHSDQSLLKGGFGVGGGGVFIYLVSSSVCVDVFCCLEF